MSNKRLEIGDIVDWLGWQGEVVGRVVLQTDSPQPKIRVKFQRPEQEFFFMDDGRINRLQNAPVLKLKWKAEHK